jgi:hypothetical protein
MLGAWVPIGIDVGVDGRLREVIAETGAEECVHPTVREERPSTGLDQIELRGRARGSDDKNREKAEHPRRHLAESVVDHDSRRK